MGIRGDSGSRRPLFRFLTWDNIVVLVALCLLGSVPRSRLSTLSRFHVDEGIVASTGCEYCAVRAIPPSNSPSVEVLLLAVRRGDGELTGRGRDGVPAATRTSRSSESDATVANGGSILLALWREVGLGSGLPSAFVRASVSVVYDLVSRVLPAPTERACST